MRREIIRMRRDIILGSRREIADYRSKGKIVEMKTSRSPLGC